MGLILVACCPGGTASNVVAFLARADVALSVSMTAASTLAAVFLTPFLTQFYAGQYVPVDAWGLFRSIALIVILPVAAGVAVNRFFKGAAAKASSFSPFVSVLFILLIVGVMLLSEGGHLAHLHLFGHPVEAMSKTTFYFSIGVLVLVDVAQTRYQKKLELERGHDGSAHA